MTRPLAWFYRGQNAYWIVVVFGLGLATYSGLHLADVLPWARLPHLVAR